MVVQSGCQTLIDSPAAPPNDGASMDYERFGAFERTAYDPKRVDFGPRSW